MTKTKKKTGSKRDHVKDLTQLISIWDQHRDLPFRVSSTRHGTHVALVSAYVNHSVNLARGVLLMHDAGLDFESISLVRSTMECTMTAAWHVVYPEKTEDFIRHSAKQRKKILEEIVEKGYSDDMTALKQIEEQFENLDAPVDPESRWLQRRFHSIGGGEQMYTVYRALCTWDHATNSLADAYTAIVERSEQNPWGIVPNVSPHQGLSDTQWVATEASLVLRAQIAMEQMLMEPRNPKQLAHWAKELKVAPTITPAEPQL